MDLYPLRPHLKIKAYIGTALGILALLTRLYTPLYQTRRLLLSYDDSTLSQIPPGRPIMATFFEPVEGGCCGMTQDGHENLVKAWEEAWQSYGWETKILNKADALKHPKFDLLESKLIKADVNGYNRRCFWRWLAMAKNSDINGGWMSDYDFFPLTLTAKIGKELGSEPGFKSWSVHVPTLIHADEASWNRLTNFIIDAISPDLDVVLLSDMYLLEWLHAHYSEEELGISSWERLTYSGFPYRIIDGYKQVDCAGAMLRLGAHLSHHDTREAVDKGYFPVVEGVTKGNLGESMNKRAEAAMIMMKDFRAMCLK